MRILTLLLLTALCLETATAQNAWREIRGGYRREVTSMAVGADGTLYHGTWAVGIFQSTDGAATWERGRVGRESLGAKISLGVADIDVDDATGEILAVSSRVFVRSTDRGATWTLQQSEIYDGSSNVSICAFIRLNGPATLVGTPTSFWKSAGGLVGWERVSFTDFSKIASDFIRVGDEILCGTDSGVYRFDRNGSIIRAALRKGMHAGVVVTALAESGGVLLAATDAGLYRSTDLGETWVGRRLEGEHLRAVLPLGGGVLLAGTHTGVHRSTDDGATWQRVVPGVGQRWATALVRRSDGLIAAGTTEGVWVSRDDGRTWTSTANGIPSANFQSVLALDSAVVLSLHAGGGCIGRSTDAGRTWTLAGGLDGIESVAMAARGEGDVVVAASSAGVLRSTDLGATWRPTAFDSSALVVAAGPSGRVLAARSEELWLSRDAGAAWTKVDREGSFRHLAIAPGGEMYALERMGFYRSTDDGVTWRRSVVRGQWMGAMAVDRFGWVWVGSDAGVSRSTDRGATFTLVENAPRDRYIDVLATSPDGHVAVATSFDPNVGIIRSTDLGATWAPVGHDFPVVGMNSFSYDAAGYLYTNVHLGSGDYFTRSERPLAPSIRGSVDPPDGASGLPPYLTLAWPSVDGAEGYHLQLVADPLAGAAHPAPDRSLHALAPRVDDSTLSAATRAVTDLTPGETWYWRVRARISGSWDEWSRHFRFTTAGGPGSAEPSARRGARALRLTVASRERGLSVTLVDGRVRRASVTITLSTITGERVATLYDEIPGSSTIAIDCGDIAPGAYVVTAVSSEATAGEVAVVAP